MVYIGVAVIISVIDLDVFAYLKQRQEAGGVKKCFQLNLISTSLIYIVKDKRIKVQIFIYNMKSIHIIYMT